MSSKRKPKQPKVLSRITTGRFERRLHMTKTGAISGAMMVANMYTDMWSGLWSSKEQRQTQRSKKLAKQAKYLVAEMGKLKGSVVKIGQMLALYGEHLFPPEVTDALHGFEDSTTALSWAAIRAVLEQELEVSRLEELEIEPEALAAASLGQVHRAVRKSDGMKLCLKVQYPGIANAIDNDLATVARLMVLTKLLSTNQTFDRLLKDIKALLHCEVDYELEMMTTQLFYRWLANQETVIVPTVFPDYCSAKVLATSFEEGYSPTSEAVQNLSQERRNRICRSFLQVFLQELFCWGTMQTDPNFGNYRIRINDEGVDQLVLLDFGALRKFPKSFLEAIKHLIAGAYRADITAVVTAAVNLQLIEHSFPEEIKYSFAELCISLLEPFNYKNRKVPTQAISAYGYSWRNSQLPIRVAKQASKNAISRYFSIPPGEFLFLQRKLLGVYTFIAVLDGQIDGCELLESYLY
ncbi:MAG: AarF/ABC1/UbiB kinase family protein [Pseudomonadales bacterium]